MKSFNCSFVEKLFVRLQDFHDFVNFMTQQFNLCNLIFLCQTEPTWIAVKHVVRIKLESAALDISAHHHGGADGVHLIINNDI